MKVLAEDFIESVKRRTFLPESQQTFTAAEILDMASEEMKTEIVPFVMSVRENYFLTYERVTLAAGVSLYGIPERATGLALKDIWFVDMNGNRQQIVYKTDVADLPPGSQSGGSSLETLLVFGDELKVFPTPASAFGYLELWYYRAPSELVATTSAAKITAVSSVGGTTTFTVDTDQSANWAVDDLIDIVSAKSPYLLWAADAAITAITSTTIAVTTTSVSDEASVVEPQVGDYICAARESNIPQIADEIHPVLAQATARSMLEGVGDAIKGDRAQARLDRMKAAVAKLISNRIESQPEVMIQTDGILAAMGATRGGWG